LILQNKFAKRKDGDTQRFRKICCSVSPTKCKRNLCAEIHQTLFAVCPICTPQKASHPMCKKIPRGYVLMKSTPGIKVLEEGIDDSG